MTLSEIAGIVGGTLVGADPEAVVTGPVEFDSRRVRRGGLFLALAGERTDGHRFAAAAVADGAVAVLATEPLDVAHIRVADGIAALTALATEAARRLDPACRTIGITGSSGKTSTKDLVAQVLERLGPTVAPPESFNNELGHPYTVLLAEPATRFLVLEVSARGIGHIAHLTRVARPDIGVVLNVGSAHLGEFGSRAAIAQAKGELVEALSAERGVAVLNADDPLVAAMAARTRARVVRVGRAPDADVRAQDVVLDALGRAAFTLVTPGGRAPVALGVLGEHQVANALAAAAVAAECGMAVEQIAAALGSAVARSRWRMQVAQSPDGLTVVNDAYNANPESVRAALETLAVLGRDGRRTVAVLGAMAELGDDAAAEHERVGALAARLGIARVLAVGEGARPLLAGTALEGSWTGEAGWVPDPAGAVAWLRERTAPGDVVLVKASRSAGLEVVAGRLLDGAPPTAGGGDR